MKQITVDFLIGILLCAIVLALVFSCSLGCDSSLGSNSSAPRSPRMIAFIAEWCEPCKKIYPELKKMQDSGVRLTIVDVGEFPDMAASYDVNSVPIFVVIFPDGGYLKTHDLSGAKKAMKKSYRIVSRN